MTLEELRLYKGLTQSECAQYLGISLRTYQTYEKDSRVINSFKYLMFYKKIEEYGQNLDKTFNTNVVLGEDLKTYYNKVKTYQKREAFSLLENFVNGQYDGKVCILYGLRRTGKTTMLFQLLGELPLESTVYIKIQTTDVMSDLIKDLKYLHNQAYRYILIDEITLLKDFINTASVLADIFSMMGMKIILSGTDSLGFAMADRNELYDRNIMIHTSYISFKEYVKLLDINSVDQYIEYGGMLKKENMSLDDADNKKDDVSFRDDESTRKYIDTSISRNIQHTLECDNDGEYFNQLRELYDAGELTNIINRIIEHMNHRFLLSIIEEQFKSHDFGLAKNNLLKHPYSSTSTVLDKVDYKTILERLKNIIDIKEKNECKIPLTESHIEKVKKYLILLDLIVNCPVNMESGSLQEYYIFVQPGMRYAITKALVYSLKQDDYFKSISEPDKDIIINKILDGVKGKMLEDMVLLETKKALASNYEIFQFRFDLGGEIDMVVYNKKNYTCSLYEIKHSDKIIEDQTKHLLNEEKCRILENKYGPIREKCVLYRGADQDVGLIHYRNVEKFLLELK